MTLLIVMLGANCCSARRLMSPLPVMVSGDDTVTLRPYAVTGPATVTALLALPLLPLMLTSAVLLVGLPIVRLAMVWPFWFQLNQLVNTFCLNESANDVHVTSPLVPTLA